MTPNRILRTITMKPVIGSRFQPTGFPDLGAALFQRPSVDGVSVDALLVESVQSMANWAERTTWDDSENEQSAPLAGLPYLRVVNDDGKFLTSSRLEAHRLASAYIMEGQIDGQSGEARLGELFGLRKGEPLDHHRLASVICSLDPLSLVHGVFFARKSKAWPWQPKIARALTCFIEADDVRPAVSGGVKKDSVSSEGGNTDTGYGMVPHQRVEYTAASIRAFVSVDLDQINAYGLGASGTELLTAVIDFELATMFSGGLRLRTSCDLEVTDVAGEPLPTTDTAVQRVGAAISSASDLLGETRDVTWSGHKSGKN